MGSKAVIGIYTPEDWRKLGNYSAFVNIPPQGDIFGVYHQYDAPMYALGVYLLKECYRLRYSGGVFTLMRSILSTRGGWRYIINSDITLPSVWTDGFGDEKIYSVDNDRIAKKWVDLWNRSTVGRTQVSNDFRKQVRKIPISYSRVGLFSVEGIMLNNWFQKMAPKAPIAYEASGYKGEVVYTDMDSLLKNSLIEWVYMFDIVNHMLNIFAYGNKVAELPFEIFESNQPTMGLVDGVLKAHDDKSIFSGNGNR